LYGIGAPRNTSAEVVEVLNKAVNAGLADPKLEARLTDLGSVPFPGQPATFGKLIADETPPSLDHAQIVIDHHHSCLS
jgi:tripartite-type tricarboxylate transporter receptor subunit TctC